MMMMMKMMMIMMMISVFIYAYIIIIGLSRLWFSSTTSLYYTQLVHSVTVINHQKNYERQSNTIQYNTIQSVICITLLYNLSRSSNKNYEKVSKNRNDFKCRLKALMSVIVRRWGGREFHAAGPE